MYFDLNFVDEETKYKGFQCFQYHTGKWQRQD